MSQNLPQTSLLLVGCGAMGSAMIQGWRELIVKNQLQVTVITPHQAAVQALPAPLNTLTWYSRPQDLPSQVRFDFLLFAVKPALLSQILPDYRGLCHEQSVVLSVAAGKTIAFYHHHLGSHVPIVRLMPNLAVALGKGVIGVKGSENIPTAVLPKIEALLHPLGATLGLDQEEKFHALTAVAGSGPAYLYLLVESLAGAAQHMGFSTDIAQRLARQTIIGASALLDKTSETAGTLKKKVTSPGGTTAAALSVLEDKGYGLPLLMQQAIQKATKRSQELAQD